MSYLECQQANTFWKGEKWVESWMCANQVISLCAQPSKFGERGVAPHTFQRALVPQQRPPRCSLDFGSPPRSVSLPSVKYCWVSLTLPQWRLCSSAKTAERGHAGRLLWLCLAGPPNTHPPLNVVHVIWGKYVL